MALKKNVDTQYGIQATYHKVALTSIDWHARQARLVTVGFIDEEARRAGKVALGTFALDIESKDFNFIPEENIIQKCYEILKGQPTFEGAEDC